MGSRLAVAPEEVLGTCPRVANLRRHLTALNLLGSAPTLDAPGRRPGESGTGTPQSQAVLTLRLANEEQDAGARDTPEIQL